MPISTYLFILSYPSGPLFILSKVGWLVTQFPLLTTWVPRGKVSAIKCEKQELNPAVSIQIMPVTSEFVL